MIPRLHLPLICGKLYRDSNGSAFSPTAALLPGQTLHEDSSEFGTKEVTGSQWSLSILQLRQRWKRVFRFCKVDFQLCRHLWRRSCPTSQTHARVSYYCKRQPWDRIFQWKADHDVNIRGKIPQSLPAEVLCVLGVPLLLCRMQHNKYGKTCVPSDTWDVETQLPLLQYHWMDKASTVMRYWLWGKRGVAGGQLSRTSVMAKQNAWPFWGKQMVR